MTSFIPTNVKDYKYDSHILNEIKSLVEISQNNGEDYALSKYPSNIKKYSMKERRKTQTDVLEEFLEKLYENKTRMLEVKKNYLSYTSSSPQQKYSFTNGFEKINLKAVEVNCRLITMNKIISQGGETMKCNLSRIGNIVFKGKMNDLINNLLSKCCEELEEHFNVGVRDINSVAMYVNDHSNSCPWKCLTIKNKMKMDCLDIDTDNPHICFYKRQLFGQGFYPYVDDDDNDDEEEEDDYYNILKNDEEKFLFDGLFFNHEVLGIMKKEIDFNADNFITANINEVCTALINFHFDYVGVTQGGLNLYLKCNKNDIVYCTNVNKSCDIPSASDYLERILYEDENIQKKLLGGIIYRKRKEKEENEEDAESNATKKKKSHEETYDCLKREKDEEDEESNATKKKKYHGETYDYLKREKELLEII